MAKSMNGAEKRYHKHLVNSGIDPKDIKVQRTIDFAPEVGMQWNMDFVLKDRIIDVKGKSQRTTAMKAQLWEVFGRDKLEIVRVLPNTGRVIPDSTVYPDPVKIRAMAARLLKNAEYIENKKDPS
jgi:hypothetical protein